MAYMMTKRSKRWQKTCLTISAALLLAVAGCASEVPTAEEVAAESKARRIAQLMRIADTTRRGGDYAAAAAMYRRAHTLAPDSAAPLRELAETSVAAGAKAEADSAFRAAIERDANDFETRLGYGRLLIDVDRPTRAAEQFRAAIRLEPTDYRAYNGLGVALDLLGSHEQAQDSYIDGLERSPDNLSMRNNLALSLALGGNYEEAVRILTMIADSPASTARVRQNLALVYGLSGDKQNAAETARIDLDEESVRNNLAYYETLRGLTGQARAAAVIGGRAPDTGAAPAEGPAESE